MGDESILSARGGAQGASEGSAWLRATYRRLRNRKAGESPGGSPTQEADVETEPRSQKAFEASYEGPRIVECPECGGAAIVRDQGVTLNGAGLCGHEYLFKMVKLECINGHRLDGMDEAGCVHAPGYDCRG